MRVANPPGPEERVLAAARADERVLLDQELRLELVKGPLQRRRRACHGEIVHVHVDVHFAAWVPVERGVAHRAVEPNSDEHQ
eukprot:7012142-Alexandrium_andersonii.AAC.1